MSLVWSEEDTRFLIDERKNGNVEYHQSPKRSKRIFWEEIANKLNEMHNTNYFTGLALTRAYYTTVAYKKAKAEAEAEAEAEVNTGTKKKRSIIGEHFYEEFSTEFWKEPGARHSNVGTTTSITPSRPQSSRIARPISSSARGRTALRTGTTSKIPRAIPSPNRSRSTTPAISRSPSSSSSFLFN